MGLALQILMSGINIDTRPCRNSLDMTRQATRKNPIPNLRYRLMVRKEGPKNYRKGVLRRFLIDAGWDVAVQKYLDQRNDLQADQG